MTDIAAVLESGLAGRYAIEREIGRGGMAVVFLARDLKHDRAVAVKVLRPELSVEAERFLREIRVAANLQHPHIVALHDSGRVGDLLYYIMPFVEGETLEARIEREPRLTARQSFALAREVAEALDYAHRQDVVHRDIKPSNILLVEGHAVVADFGIARAVHAQPGQALTEVGLSLGTPAYMSPEQVTGDALDGRSDIYSLGCVLFEMLAGSPPFTGPTAVAILAARLSGNVPTLRDHARTAVPAGAADAVLAKALAPAAEERYASAGMFALAIAELESGATSGPARLVAAPPVAMTSVAVLPFANLSADQDTEYFSDGVTEEIINALTQLPRLRVASRTSSFTFKGKDEDIRSIGAKLNVGAVLEGSVRRQGARLRITAQLINVADGYHLWSERYDRDATDVFAVQDDIARTIANRLRVAPSEGAAQPLVKRHTDDLDAYNLYLKGRFHWNKRGEGLFTAAAAFEAAIARDPAYAQAHTGRAEAYNLLGWYGFLPPAQAFPAAKASATEALRLDESLAEAHTSLAFALMCYDWAWAESGREFARAMELNPGYATTFHWYAEYLLAMSRADEAIVAARNAQQLDPLGLGCATVLGWTYYAARRFDEALAELRKTAEMDASFTPVMIFLALTYMARGMYDEAIAVCRREMALSPQPATAGFLVMALAKLGRSAVARGILDETMAAATERNISPVQIAFMHLGLGETDAGFQWLERAVNERHVWLTWILHAPLMDEWRDHPRFAALVARLGHT